MFPVLKTKILNALRQTFAAELGDDVENLVQSLVEDFCPPTVAAGSRFISVIGNSIVPAGEQHSRPSEEYFFKVRFLIRSPYNMRTLKGDDLDNLTTGLYKLEQECRNRLHGAGGMDIINAANETLTELGFATIASPIRWKQTSAEPILLDSDYFGSEPIDPLGQAGDITTNLAEARAGLMEMRYDYEGMAIDSFYGGPRVYHE